MTADVLQQGFALANRRIGLILLDMLWKALWLGLTVGVSFLAFGWFAGQLQSIGWEGTGTPVLDQLIASALVRQWWAAKASDLLWMMLGVGVVSLAVWFVLEAYFRARIALSLWERAGPTGKAWVFLASSLVKTIVLTAVLLLFATITLGPYLSTPVAEWPQLWPETRGAVLVSVVALAFLAFIAVLVETLVRCDAFELFGRDLIRVTGVVGTLAGFEGLMISTCGVALITALLSVSRASEFVAVLLFAAGTMIFLSFLHSYLLLVRFSAIGIMRRDVVEV